MKKFLLALVLIVPMVLTGCGGKNTPIQEPTIAELDSIRHCEINDSINNLKRIELLGSLYMGMTREEYDSLIGQANRSIRIGRVLFEEIDTVLFHDSIHVVILKGRNSENVFNMDDMARCVRSGEETYREVINILSSKYGKPLADSRMGELSDNGHQFGSAIWEFDRFSVQYEQNQWAYLKNNEHTITSKITYSIPQIQTAEEKHITDSIVAAWEHDRDMEEQRQKEAKHSL